MFGGELLSPRGRQAVVFGPLTFFRLPPLRFHPALFFEAVQRRIHRALGQIERAYLLFEANGGLFMLDQHAAGNLGGVLAPVTVTLTQ